eukprot:1183996-Prorocentrum_minimum.AAC.1
MCVGKTLSIFAQRLNEASSTLVGPVEISAHKRALENTADRSLLVCRLNEGSEMPLSVVGLVDGANQEARVSRTHLLCILQVMCDWFIPKPDEYYTTSNILSTLDFVRTLRVISIAQMFSWMGFPATDTEIRGAEDTRDRLLLEVIEIVTTCDAPDVSGCRPQLMTESLTRAHKTSNTKSTALPSLVRAHVSRARSRTSPYVGA